jgi:hypothetical protein
LSQRRCTAWWLGVWQCLFAQTLISTNAKKPPQPFHIPLERRRFLKSLALISAGFTVPGYLAEALTLTPQVTQGPYYPRGVNIPLDDDNDLALLAAGITAPVGYKIRKQWTIASVFGANDEAGLQGATAATADRE